VRLLLPSGLGPNACDLPFSGLLLSRFLKTQTALLAKPHPADRPGSARPLPREGAIAPALGQVLP